MRVKQNVPWSTKTLAEEKAGDWAVTITLLSKQGGQKPMQGQCSESLTQRLGAEIRRRPDKLGGLVLTELESEF